MVGAHSLEVLVRGRILFVRSPSGNGEMFLEMGKLGAGATEEQLAEVGESFGMVGLSGEAGRPWRSLEAED
jgi:hypothetical protein